MNRIVTATFACLVTLTGCSGPVSQPTARPSAAASLLPAPTPKAATLAVGNFTSHGVATQLDARGSGADVTGTMTVSDSGLRATVALECARTTEGSLILIGGLVTDSTFDDYFPQDRRVAVIFQRGDPVKAVWWVPLVADPPVATCQALVEDVIDLEEVSAGLEPIGGSVELGT
jgi:hypothetical protein